jgi:hypothetical protein
MTDKSGTAVALSGATRIKLALSVSASIRANLALNQLQAARRFALQCGETETANLGQPLGPFFDTIRDSVIASVILSVLSLEANINEHFVDPEVKDTFEGLSNNAREKLVELMGNARILAKYQHVLDIRGKPRFDHGSQPYQDTELLVRLRNALVHFKPEWDNEQTEHAKLGTQTRTESVSRSSRNNISSTLSELRLCSMVCPDRTTIYAGFPQASWFQFREPAEPLC